MNFFRTIQAQATSWKALRDAMIRRRMACEHRRDLPSEEDLLAFLARLDDDDFHRLLVITGAFMAKARGYDVFTLPHPPEV